MFYNMSIGIDLVWKYDYLKPSFKFILDNNSANSAPYHNTGHLLKVLSRVHEGIEYFRLGDKKELILAALWHDYGHSQGEFDDIHNIAVSRDSVTKFLVDNPIEGVDPNMVVEIIRTTQYPYVVPNDELSLEQGILRDADMMTCLEGDWFQTVILGIRKEAGITMEQMILGQIKFLETAEMSTEWGKEVKRKHWSKGTDSLRKLKEIYLG